MEQIFQNIECFFSNHRMSLTFFITCLVVLSAAFITLRSAKKLREADHENKISEFRHEWLRELRITASHLVENVHSAQTHCIEMNCLRDQLKSSAANNAEIDPDFSVKMKNAQAKFEKARSEFYRHSAKIKLFFKPDDPEAKELLQQIDKSRDKLLDFGSFSLDDTIVDDIVNNLQVVLKENWEVTKKRSWSR